MAIFSRGTPAPTIGERAGKVGAILRKPTEKSAIQHAQRWLALDPLHEPVHRQLMQLYAWSDNRRPKAQYQTYVQSLRKELQTRPDAETEALYQAIKPNTPTPNGSVQPVTVQPVREVVHVSPAPARASCGFTARLTSVHGCCKQQSPTIYQNNLPPLVGASRSAPNSKPSAPA
ncbi:MAG: bacterial transcriptional activator domain-containing protein [Caldilineaceae bacterium]